MQKTNKRDTFPIQEQIYTNIYKPTLAGGLRLVAPSWWPPVCSLIPVRYFNPILLLEGIPLLNSNPSSSSCVIVEPGNTRYGCEEDGDYYIHTLIFFFDFFFNLENELCIN